MRGGKSVSMLQPGKNMAVSKFMGTSTLSGVKGKSMVGRVPGGRKVEGHDMTKTAKSRFEASVSQLKNKPTQKVLEDEYIGGLQEEIKYLEYELKLLKDKELIEREGVNELDNFLKDEIPINENILAMKNKYNATKEKLQKQLSNLNMQKGEASDLLNTQKNQIERLHEIIGAHRGEKDARRREFKAKLGDIVKEINLSIDEHAAMAEDNRRMNQEVKRMNEEMATIQRANEKEKVGEVRAMEEKTKKAEKFEQRFEQATEEMIETTQQWEELRELEDKNPLVDPMEEQNSMLRKRIMLNEKQKSTAENNIAEIQLMLREEERERETERQHKVKYLNVLEECRVEVQKLEREADDMLRDKALRAKKVLIKETNHDLGEKEEVFDLLTDRLRNLEQECTNLIQEKKELQDTLNDQGKLEKELLENTAATEESITQSRSTGERLKRVTDEVRTETEPVVNNLEKFKGRIPMVEREIDRKNVTIGYLNKQIDLLKELKGLDLEHLQLISNGGAQVQNMLHSFIKNWEKIKAQQ